MNIPDINYLEFHWDGLEDEAEISKMENEIAATKAQFSKDINIVVNTLQQLDAALKANPDYYTRLKLTDATDEYLNYFKNYPVDVAPNEYGFISDGDTNFGVDIRAILQYLTFAQTQGATKTYFTFR